MTTQTNIPTLASLDYLPYLNEGGLFDESFAKKVGVYAIFDEAKNLQFIGYSRDISLSLKQHFVRQCDRCYWFKVETIDRPSRSILEQIRDAWIAENGSVPPGNGEDEAKWTQAIDVKTMMTEEERESYEKLSGDELSQIKCLKKIARRVEAELLEKLQARGLSEKLRFNPKQKETGLLDLK
ncbi:MAG: GIY-YIG nuclease family protein [Cyanobacteria bacterium J007]|nr:MAG: GIY-YIG nuclease family protein [Cyanobacteria bacterium J007]